MAAAGDPPGMRPQYARVGIPVLLVKGTCSERITPEILADIEARCPHVELAEVPAPIITSLLDNRAACIAAVKGFLAR